MKIILLFFTFSGIYCGFAQKPAAHPVDSATTNEQPNNVPDNNEPLMFKEKPSIKLFPNPAKNKVDIEIKGFEPGYMRVQLLDNNGSLKREDKRLVFSGNETIVFMFSQKPGIYFLILKQNDKIIRSRLIIQ